MLSDLRLAFRSLVKSPGFTLVALATLALGIGLNTAMFSMLNGFLLRPLSFPEPERLFRLDRHTPQRAFGEHTLANYRDLARESTEVAELAGVRFWGFTLTEAGQPADNPLAVRVTANYFDLLGTRATLGRTFLPTEDVPGANDVIVLSHRYWQDRFGGDPGILGRKVRLDGQPVEIVGVMAEEADTARILGPVSVYRPLGATPAEWASRSDAGLTLAAIGRYRAGITREQAALRLDAVARRLAADHPAENAGLTVGLRSLQSTTLGGTGRNVTFMLVGLSSLVLLIASANLANLLLARALTRAREFSIRAALGASRAQLIKPLALECLLLAVAGALGASLLSVWTCDWLATRFSGPGSQVDFSTDVRVLGFTILVSLCTALFFGVAPAWWASRVDVNEAIKSGARGSTSGRAQTRYRELLIVSQFALSLVLLSSAGLFLRGLQRLTHADMGWNPAPVISGVVNLASARFKEATPIIQFHTQLRERLMTNPAVANVAVSYETPLFNPPATRRYMIAGQPPPREGEEIVAFTNGVSASFADTVGLRLTAGRFFDDTDQERSRPVVVINETMARTLFPNENPVGHRLAVAGGEPVWAEIVGVVRDTRTINVSPSPILFQVYKPFPQESWQYATVSIRAHTPELAASLAEPLRQGVTALDPDQPVIRLMTIPQRIERNVGFWQTVERLLVGFAGLGLLLAAIGIYGVITRLVLQRTGEIGIRMALGADRRQILQLVLGGGMRTALVGIALGGVGAALFARFLSRVLPVFGGSAWEPALAGGLLLVLTAALACWLPARRATKVDPMVALRAE
ncbi:MAG TPA: ABC transporter permease [Lacunisphaera sp.]|nr:ABC transporter permease [Lacunisphaera sp.]